MTPAIGRFMPIFRLTSADAPVAQKAPKGRRRSVAAIRYLFILLSSDSGY